MQLAEVGKLLTIIASFDNRKLDESTALAWKMMIDREVPDASVEDAQEVILDWFATTNPYFEVRHLIEGLKLEMRLDRVQIAADVRSAKAHGLVDSSWSERDPLQWMVANSLYAARLRERTEALELQGSYDPADSGTVDVEVGRRV